MIQRKVKHAAVLRVRVNLGQAEGTVELNEVIIRNVRMLHAELPIILSWLWLFKSEKNFLAK